MSSKMVNQKHIRYFQTFSLSYPVPEINIYRGMLLNKLRANIKSETA